MGLDFDFRRGKQMIVHDPRLNYPSKPPKALRPPAAYNVWTVSTADPLRNILGWVAAVGNGVGRLDALHIMAHGQPDAVQLGKDWIQWANVPEFKALQSKVGRIVLFSCSVGGATRQGYQLNFGNAIAAYSGAPCIICYATQWYNYGGGNVIDFGAFEGSVYMFSPSGQVKTYNPYGKQQFDLGKAIFG
jgi:hypothetical protein